MSTTLTVALVNSLLYGDKVGNRFNDAEDVGYVSATSSMTIDTTHPINKITIRSGWVVDGISVYYSETNNSQTVTHGTQEDTTSNVGKYTITLNANETIIAVSGRAGNHPSFGTTSRICQISFSIYDNSTGTMRIAGPYGNADGKNYGTPFRVTANGFVIGFGGYAINSSNNVGSDSSIGLFGLTFIDVAYRTT